MGIALSPEDRRVAGVLDDITDIHQEICRCEAGYLRKVAELATVGGSKRSVTNELALALRLGKNQAGKEIAHACALTRLLPRTLTPQDHGMSSLAAELPAEVASAVYGSLTEAARALRKTDKSRTTDQLRADIFAERLLAGNGGSLKAHVYVYVDLFSLLELNNTLAHLPGYGEIPVELLRDRIFDPASTWSRLITDPDTGQLLSVGRSKYRPPADLEDYVRIRARTCSHPGCNQPAQFGDIDHTKDWAKGGETSADNLDGRCRYHHLLKDEPGWNYTTGPDGVTIITTPAGRTYTSTPEPIHEPRQPEEPPPF